MLKWQVASDAVGELSRGQLPMKQALHLGRDDPQGPRYTRVALAPAVEQQARRMLEGSASAAEFSLSAADLPLLAGPGGVGELQCRLQVEGGGVEDVEMEADDWFQWKLARASGYRARGNAAFKSERLRAARRLYKKALAWLASPSECSYSAEERAEVEPLQVACHFNLATCLWKLGELEACIAHCSSALELDERHVKARYRRGQAFLATKEFELALADLAATLELEPESKLFATSLERARVAKQQFAKKQREAFGKLFPQ